MRGFFPLNEILLGIYNDMNDHLNLENKIE